MNLESKSWTPRWSISGELLMPQSPTSHSVPGATSASVAMRVGSSTGSPMPRQPAVPHRTPATTKRNVLISRDGAAAPPVVSRNPTRARQAAGPGIHAVKRFEQLRRCAAVGGVALDQRAQCLAGAVEPRPDRRGRGVEDLGELGDLQLLPVVQLEQGLLFDGELAQRIDQPALFLTARDPRARRRDQLRDRRDVEVELGALALAAPQRSVELVARDGEQVGAKARLAAELVARTQAGEERHLGQLVGLGLALGLEEAEHALEVALEQRLPGGLVAGAPAIEQRNVIGLVHGATSVPRHSTGKRVKAGTPR